MKIIGLLSFQSSGAGWCQWCPAEAGLPPPGLSSPVSRGCCEREKDKVQSSQGPGDQPPPPPPVTTETLTNNHHFITPVSSLSPPTYFPLRSLQPWCVVCRDCTVYSQVSGQFIKKYFLQNVLPHTQSFMQGQTEYGPVEQRSGKNSRVYTLLYKLQYYMDYVSMYFVNYVCSYPCFIMIIYRDNI